MTEEQEQTLQGDSPQPQGDFAQPQAATPAPALEPQPAPAPEPQVAAAPAPQPQAAVPVVITQQPIIKIVTETKKKSAGRRAAGAIVRFIIWLVVIVVVIALALYISAWIAGFTNADGFPILFNKTINGTDYTGMIDWIRASLGF